MWSFSADTTVIEEIKYLFSNFNWISKSSDQGKDSTHKSFNLCSYAFSENWDQTIGGYPTKFPELGTLEWINFNPDFLIRISIVETFHFYPNRLFFPLLGYPLIVFSNENISVLSLVARFSLIGCYSFSDDYSFSYTFKIILQDYVNLEIIKKRESSINRDIHHSKVFSSDDIVLTWSILGFI